MERSGTRPAPAVELDDLRDLVGREGPFTSVYLPLERETDNAASRNSLVWHAVRDSLVESPDAAIDAIEVIVPEAHHFGDGIGMFCAGAEPCIVEAVDPVPTSKGAGRVDAVPWLAPLIASRQHTHDATARDTIALLEEFRGVRGQHDRAVEGVEGTIAALQRGQVDVLLVHDDHDDERMARDGRLVDVAIRDALLTGADVHVVPKGSGLTDGLGAILRS